jgi:ABC-2 type transport system ATP-binding protein
VDPAIDPTGLVRVRYDGDTAQPLINRITTPLSVLRVREPSLEEAYVELLRDSGEEAA